MKPHKLSCARLISACARNRSNEVVWQEFLARYGSWIKRFITRACALWSAKAGAWCDLPPGAIEQNDLFQSVMVRLVENRCAAMKAFSGDTEHQWLAYLAAITVSVVRESFRWQVRPKRIGGATLASAPFHVFWERARDRDRNQYLEIEKVVLAGEVIAICEQMIDNLAGKHSARDRLIFRLYFLHDASISQIAATRGVGLSKSGVWNVIDGLLSHVQKVIPREVARITKSDYRLGTVAKMGNRRQEKISRFPREARDRTTYR